MKFLANKPSSISSIYLTKARYMSDEHVYLSFCILMLSCSVTRLGQNDLSRAEGRIWLWVKWKRDEQVLKCFRPSCYWNKLINSYFCSDLICTANVKKKSFIGWIWSSLFNTSLTDVELVYLTYLNKLHSTIMRRYTL